MLIVVPDIKKGPQPGHTTAVEGALVVADAKTVKVQIVPSTLPLLMLKGDDPKTIYKKAFEKKAVVLIAEKITEVVDGNKDMFPAFGKARVEGKALCGKNDLKIFDEPTLAVINGDLPIVLDGPKARGDAKDKGIIRATGTLFADTEHVLLRLTADDVVEVKLK
jgi:hypothetical protein